MPAPVVLLDADGVVNALSKKPPTTAWSRDQWIIGKAEASPGQVYPMMIARPVVDFFNQLHRSGSAEVRWHTTWQHAAQNIADLAGFDKFDVAEAPEYADYANFQKQAIVDGHPTWWKLPAAQRVVQDEKRDLIWVDDDMPYEWTRKAQYDPKLGGNQMVLTVDPYSMTGLTLNDLTTIKTFVAACWVEVK